MLLLAFFRLTSMVRDTFIALSFARVNELVRWLVIISFFLFLALEILMRRLFLNYCLISVELLVSVVVRVEGYRASIDMELSWRVSRFGCRTQLLLLKA